MLIVVNVAEIVQKRLKRTRNRTTAVQNAEVSAQTCYLHFSGFLQALRTRCISTLPMTTSIPPHLKFPAIP
jgi:hypothetical protein